MLLHLVDVLALHLCPPPPEPLHLGPHELQLGHQPHHGGRQVLGGGGHTMNSLHPPTWYILQFRRRLLLSSSSESSSNTGETIRIYIESFSTNS